MPSEFEMRGASLGKRSSSATLPGLSYAAAMAALSALLFGFWASRDHGALRSPVSRGDARVAAVAPGDIPAALDTLAVTSRQLKQFGERPQCERRLAWVTIVRASNQAPGRIRLQSGSYISPAFELLDTPVRVALPYPAPYATGHGVIAVVGATTAATVALTPPWHVPSQAVGDYRQVSWTPTDLCPSGSK